MWNYKFRNVGNGNLTSTESETFKVGDIKESTQKRNQSWIMKRNSISLPVMVGEKKSADWITSWNQK